MTRAPIAPFDASKPTAKYSSELLASSTLYKAGFKLLASPDTTLERTFIEFGIKQIVLGRDPQEGACNYIIRDNFLSRSHSKIYFHKAERAHYLEDLDSTNGTSVNGQEISCVKLNQGDVVRIGETIFLYCNNLGVDLDPNSVIRGRSFHVGNLQQECKKIAKFNRTGGGFPVLVLGGTGVGKTYIAKELHRLSRHRGRLISVNCAGIPAALIESVLFGHVKGAFTDATRDHTGLFEEAHGGTLFLDEVGELPIELQPKFLKVLDEKNVLRLGSTCDISVDFQLICATNRNLETEVKQGLFREDLYYRISKFTLAVSPLRLRREDILFWFDYFFMRFIKDADQLIKIPRMDGAFTECMLLADWNGNIREIEKVATHLFLNHLNVKQFSKTLLESDAVLHAYKPTCVHPQIRPESLDTVAEPTTKRPQKFSGIPSRDELLRDLKAHKGKIYRIAKQYGRDRKSVYRWCKRYNLDFNEYRDSDC